jgi:hypothetical protein
LTADRIRCAAQQAFASPADWRDEWIYFLMASFPAFNSSFPIITAYGIQDFLRANPFFADVQANADQELRALVDTAHAAGLYVIFDIVLNHTANVFGYAPDGDSSVSYSFGLCQLELAVDSCCGRKARSVMLIQLLWVIRDKRDR